MVVLTPTEARVLRDALLHDDGDSRSFASGSQVDPYWVWFRFSWEDGRERLHGVPTGPMDHEMVGTTTAPTSPTGVP